MFEYVHGRRNHLIQENHFKRNIEQNTNDVTYKKNGISCLRTKATYDS